MVLRKKITSVNMGSELFTLIPIYLIKFTVFIIDLIVITILIDITILDINLHGVHIFIIHQNFNFLEVAFILTSFAITT